MTGAALALCFLTERLEISRSAPPRRAGGRHSSSTREESLPRPKEFDPDTALDRAMEAFWERGYESTSLRDLEERMGINRFSLYATFESKRELFLRSLDRYRDKVVPDLWIKALEAPDAALPAIRAYFQAFVDLAASAGTKGCLMTNSAVELGRRDAKAARRVRAHLQRLEDAFARALAHAAAKGEIVPTGDPRAQARYLTACAQGLAVMTKVQRDRRLLLDVVDSVLRSLN